MAKKKNEDDILSEEEKEIEQKRKQQIKQQLKTLYEHTNILRKGKHMKWVQGADGADSFTDKVLSQSTVESWNAGKDPTLSSVLKIINYFDVSFDWLFGLSSGKELSPVTLTYKKWIDVMESYLGNGIVKPFYRPELDNNFPGYDENTQKEREAFIEKLDSSFGFQTSQEPRTSYIYQKPDGSKKPKALAVNDIPLEDNVRLSYGYVSHSDNIYDVSKDMGGVYPDILKIKDTFLRCITACLHYNKKELSKADYESFKKSIIDQYGDEKVLNLDVYELRASPKLLKTINEMDNRGLSERYSSVSETIFAKYKSIQEINTKELEIIWKKLNFCKEQLNEKKIKTKTQVSEEYFEELEKNRNQTAGDDSAL